MYLDFSLSKIGAILTIVFVLLVSVAFTLSAKLYYFGTTPYTYSVFLGTKYAIDTVFESLRGRLPGLFGAFGAQKAQSSELARGVPVLTYHRIVSDSSDTNNVTVQRFKDQMRSLKDAGWNTIRLDDFEAFLRGEKSLPERSFLLTFDDGAKESFYPVDPILGALGFHAVMFVISKSAENAGTLGSVYYLSPNEIERMIKSGRWDIGSHSFDGHHPYPVDENGATGIFFADRLWRDVDARLETPEEFSARVQDDLTHAKEVLESTYHVPVQSFAFPLGNETGEQGANNFPGGSADTARIASTIYQVGFVQTEHQTFTQAVPRSSALVTLAATTSNAQAIEKFLVRRVHVDYDWDGKRLLSILENGLPKSLPYEDDFSTDRGWISAWGGIDVGRNNFSILGGADSSASTFLDGTEHWNDYSLDAAVNWQQGDFFVLADVVNSKTYDSCAFSPGRVRILSSHDGVVAELKDVRDASIQFGSGVRMGIRVHGVTIECTWNFRSLAETYSRTWSGGIGFQLWSKTPGTSVQISSLIARPTIESATSSSTQ